MKSWFEIELFELLGNPLTLGEASAFGVFMFVLFIIYFIIRNRSLPILTDTARIDPKNLKRFFRLLGYIGVAILVLVAIHLFGLNVEIHPTESIKIRLAVFVQAFIIVQIARMIDWLLSNLIVNRYYGVHQNEKEDPESTEKNIESSAKGSVQWIVYVFAAIIILKRFNLDFTIFPIQYEDHVFQFRISNILTAILVLLLAKLFIWTITQIFLYGFFKKKAVDFGRQYAFNQLLSYVIYVIAAIVALHYLGIEMTLIWGGAAALLVGAGLGLQQAFNDLFSGIVLLFDRAVEVGDVLKLNDEIGTVRKIGLRSSIFETYKNESKIIPNRILVNDEVISYTYKDNKIRFQIDVGVAYESDTDQVKKILKQVAKNNPYITEHPAPFVRLVNFGASSLDFSLYFFTRNFQIIEDLKSDLRFAVNRQFRENNIEIPYPQRVVYTKKETE